MIGNFRKKRSFALTGNSERTILTEVGRDNSSEPSLHILATSEGPPDQEVTIHRLLSSIPDVKGTVSVALPLYFFEIVTLSIPAMPEEAVGKALPYHLGKTLAKPLQDFIYDWQLNRRHKDTLEITAYLFPAATFNVMRNELSRKQLELKYLEPDVFAAFAYLDLTGRLSLDKTTLCTLVWPGYSSHAIYEKGQIKLVRSVMISPPDTPYSVVSESREEDQPFEEIPAPEAETDALPDTGDAFMNLSDNSSIIADFSLSTRGDESARPASAADLLPPDLSRKEGVTGASSVSSATGWAQYISNLGLEIIRTKDFYGLILKGSNINNLFVGGGEEFLHELGDETRPAIGMEPEELSRRKWSRDLPSPLEAVCIGTGSR